MYIHTYARVCACLSSFSTQDVSWFLPQPTDDPRTIEVWSRAYGCRRMLKKEKKRAKDGRWLAGS